MNLPSITHISDIRVESGHTADLIQHMGVITSEKEDGVFVIDNSIEAFQAFSCVIKPEKGDLITCFKSGHAAYVTAVLKRAKGSKAEIELEGSRELTIRSDRLNLIAGEHLDIKSLKSIEITAYLGSLSLIGMNLITSVRESIIQNAKNHINSVKNYTLNVKQLLRTHGKHHIMTADEEIRMDGERINMG